MCFKTKANQIKRSKIGAKCKTDRDKGRRHRLTKDYYIDIFLNPRCDSIFRASRLCFFNGRFSAEIFRGHQEFVSYSPNLTSFLAAIENCSVCGDLCTYNFITSMISFRFSAHVTCFLCSLIHPAGTFCLAISNDGSVQGQYATVSPL